MGSDATRVVCAYAPACGGMPDNRYLYDGFRLARIPAP